MEYEFTLRFGYSSIDADELVERLGEAGCGDALVGIGLPGQIALSFVREGACAQQAICSALMDVKQALSSPRP